MKKYLDKNVYQAFVERANYILDEFELIYLSVSGGKDSSVMVQLFNMVCEQRNRSFDVYYVDLEAQYQGTVLHVEELKKLSCIRDFYHLCLPLNLSNANSIFQTHWTCWNTSEKDRWVREMPDDAINISNHPFSDFFREKMEFEDFMVQFPKWLMAKHNKKKVAGLVGIRTDESYNRFRSIAFGKNLYNNKNWSTDNGKGYYSFYPIYDWRTEDIWHAVSKFDLTFNSVYEMLYKNGVSIHEQRICQPYGQDQRVSLDQWAALEPDTWTRIVNRVSGANFGNIYAKTSLLGHNGTEKPEHMSWEQYAVFLLESIGLYSPELRDHYVRKINLFFDYFREQEGVSFHQIPDEITPSEVKRLHGDRTNGKWIHWKRIARTIEKNDFACKGLSYGLTKQDVETAKKLKNKWGKMLGLEEHQTKPMKNLAKEIGYEKD